MSTPEVIAGRYRLVRRVGSGAMGVVWEGWDERLQRPVALKLLHVQPGLSDEEAELAKNRAMREARITARLDHPNAVPVFDVVEQDGRPCLVMQFLPSTPLSGVLKERRTLPPVEAARIGAQIASALSSAHAVGIVHRDVKPGNILMAEDGTARISDFGISHALGDATLTSTGMVHGTPAYLAPEVALGGTSTSASDVFGLGATIYTMLQGAPPFGTDPNPIVLLHRVASGRFDPPTDGGALTPVVLEMLATDPTLRPSMAELAARLTMIAATQPVDPEAVSPATIAFTREVQLVTPAQHDPPTPAIGEVPTTRVTPVPAAPPTTVPPTVVPSTDAPSAAVPSTWVRPADPPAGPPSGPGGPVGTPPARAPRRVSRVLLVLAGLVIVALAAALLLPGLNPLNTATGDPSSAVSQSADSDPGDDPETASASAGRTDPPSPPTTGSAPATTAPAPTASSSRASTSSSASSSKTSSSKTSSSKTSSSSTSPSGRPSSSPSATASESASSSQPTSGTVQGDPTAGELEDAIKSYYGLVTGDRDAAWSRLTSSYQKTRAGGRSSYDGFWRDVERVSVRRVQGDPPDQVEATIRYTFEDGRIVTEKTDYVLVNDDGTLKINRSTVVTSSTS